MPKLSKINVIGAENENETEFRAASEVKEEWDAEEKVRKTEGGRKRMRKGRKGIGVERGVLTISIPRTSI